MPGLSGRCTVAATETDPERCRIRRSSDQTSLIQPDVGQMHRRLCLPPLSNLLAEKERWVVCSARHEVHDRGAREGIGCGALAQFGRMNDSSDQISHFWSDEDWLE